MSCFHFDNRCGFRINKPIIEKMYKKGEKFPKDFYKKTMIKFFAFLSGIVVFANDNLPSLKTCTHESNYGYRAQYSPRIVGGIEAKENQWPFIVDLSFIRSDYGEDFAYHICAGTIIDNYWVLT